MRRKKIEGILCLTGMLLLTGCGTKAYDLTDRQLCSTRCFQA